ncbi:4-hydroxy-tetrahydrodipicolinate reductase [Caldanaerobius polysaccharolyticus]|uniref:4-hydroxy-tetrahydrodipicolinate reductase n=1 Tax=Caldanaerobius polysaccharolyticus TaxID=44256 RepID=UPI00047B38E5|nr:4-hydroxy-tetrahydrodipicolinate reductase [Caldanaerobius polysaccharolyticus]
MIRLIVHGCNRKMGKNVVSAARNNGGFEVVAGVDKLASASREDFPIYSRLIEVKEKADVVIDFSHHTAIPDLLEDATHMKIPVVIATTGLNEAEHHVVIEKSNYIPIFMSANMSLGINLLIKLVVQAAQVLYKSSDIEIVEKHHNQKLDAPSGTAFMIANAINQALSNTLHFTYGRSPQSGKREKSELGIHAIRGGTIVGEHEVIFAGPDEILEIKHIAQSRAIFAQGALKAAEFIIGKQPGLYSMKDLLEKG